MTEMRARVRAAEGPAATWDPADQGEFRRLAGPQFVGTDGDLAMVRTEGGCVQHVHPGWFVIRPAGSAAALFCTPKRAEVVPAPLRGGMSVPAPTVGLWPPLRALPGR